MSIEFDVDIKEFVSEFLIKRVSELETLGDFYHLLSTYFFMHGESFDSENKFENMKPLHHITCFIMGDILAEMISSHVTDINIIKSLLLSRAENMDVVVKRINQQVIALGLLGDVLVNTQNEEEDKKNESIH